MTELLVKEPRALMMDPREVAARAHQLEAIVTLSATAGVRPEWKKEVRVTQSPLALTVMGMCSLLTCHTFLPGGEQSDGFGLDSLTTEELKCF